ncbi:MAG: 23S rRNA (adenine(2503)-C(2))-methyltransferase RlmN [Clostridia bacterium]|nr:23S rRNA (adenine(2503)-C(2))-methyltransferase RlmN [Clostridia bacterium]
MDNKKFCLDLTFDDLKEWCTDKGLPQYRAEQIYKWLSAGVIDLNEMNNLPKNIRAELDNSFYFNGTSVNEHEAMIIVNEFVSKIDGTRKLVYELYDGHIIETVLMRYKLGVSVCISSQAGCKMGCTFCASAHAGFGRSLTSGEMLGQVVISQHHIGERIRSVVVMGIGEPFDNYDNLIGFIRLANNKDGLNLGSRHITVSTCGLVPRMKDFTELNSQVNLSISLHAPNDELRKQLMPIANKYSLNEVLDACREYIKKTNRRITFEYSLFDNVNDSREQALELVHLLKGIHCHINLIAANEFDGSPYKRSSGKRVDTFRKTLEELNMNATLRREMGTDIMAACGQLRRGMEEAGKK